MTTLMSTTLNNYTIDDFLKLKPIIYEYCVNLTQKKTYTSWYRDFASADDLYQDVYLYVHEKYFNKPQPPMEEGKFIQIMKNCTYWSFYRKINPRYKNNNITNNLNYFQENPITEYLFQEKLFENAKYFEDIQDNPDYNFAMKGLKFSERLAVCYFLKGYTKTEVAKKFGKDYNFIPRIVHKIDRNLKNEKIVLNPVTKIEKRKTVINDLAFVKSKVQNFEVIFKTDKLVSLYSLYLQGFDHKTIAEKFNKSVSQVNVEIYRINQKIKKYATGS